MKQSSKLFFAAIFCVMASGVSARNLGDFSMAIPLMVVAGMLFFASVVKFLVE